jgi:hypothetical protein
MLIPENKSVTKLEWTGGLSDYWNRTHYFPENWYYTDSVVKTQKVTFTGVSGDFMPLLKEFIPHTWLKSHCKLYVPSLPAY